MVPKQQVIDWANQLWRSGQREKAQKVTEWAAAFKGDVVPVSAALARAMQDG